MKVILLENIKRIGSIGEVIDVKRGFARNYLIANKKALYASKQNILKSKKLRLSSQKKIMKKNIMQKKFQKKLIRKSIRLKS